MFILFCPGITSGYIAPTVDNNNIISHKLTNLAAM